MTRRPEKIRAKLGQLGALLLTGEAARFYATGLQASAGIVLILPKENVFITDFRYIETARGQLSDCFTVEMNTHDRKPEQIVCDLLPENAAVGIESNVMTVDELAGWKKAVRKAGKKVRFTPAEGIVQKLRAVKEPFELEKMRQAQRITERALTEVLSEILRPGVTEQAVCAELVYRLLRNGAERTSFDPIVVSGANGSLPHGTPSGRVIQRGDFVTIDIGCVYEGYCSDMTRTVAVGTASPKMREVYSIVLQAQTAGIAAAKEGVTGRSIDQTARQVITGAGYSEFFGHGFGHGIGIEIHESPNANQSEREALPEGAVITAEPGIYLPECFGVRIEDMLVLTKTGCENLTKMPKDLLVV